MTRKEIYNSFDKVYSVGYCDLQYLLKFQNRCGFNMGVYGWNYDIFSFGDIAICTGYRGTPGKKIPFEIRNKYEQKAKKITESLVPYDEYKKKIKRLVNNFIKELQEV